MNFRDHAPAKMQEEGPSGGGEIARCISRRRTPITRGKAARNFAIGVMATGALVVSACSNGGSAASSTGKGNASQLNVVLSGEPPTLDPCQDSQSSTGLVVRSNITEGQTKRNATTGKLNPALATSWSKSGTDTWTFKLRSGVTFSNGSPLTAQAVQFSINRALKPALNCEVAGQFFENSHLTTKVVDAHTISFTTKEPDPILPLRLSFLDIVPTSTTTSGPDNDPIGTGPYQLVSWDHGVSITMKRNPKYWGTKPDFANVKYVFRSDPTVRSTMVRNGEADIAQDLDPTTSSDIGLKYNSYQIPFLRLDPSQAPMNDIRIRQAISYAIDVKGLIKAVFNGLGTPASQLVPPNAIGYDSALKPWPYDPTKAKQLVAAAKAAGTPVNKQILLVGRTDLYANSDKLMAAVQNELQSIGLNATVKMLDVNAWLGYQRRPFPSGRGPVILQSEHGNQGGDASFTMANNYGSNGLVSSYGTSALDALIAKAQTLSGAARQSAYVQAVAYVHNEVRDVPLIQAGGLIGESKRVTYTPTPASGDEIDLADIHAKH